MYKDKLEQANEYIKINKIPKDELPVFHVTPYCGWMNDPNGFSVYQGKVHLFYQHNISNHTGYNHLRIVLKTDCRGCCIYRFKGGLSHEFYRIK